MTTKSDGKDEPDDTIEKLWVANQSTGRNLGCRDAISEFTVYRMFLKTQLLDLTDSFFIDSGVSRQKFRVLIPGIFDIFKHENK